jgi:hypothetical protein
MEAGVADLAPELACVAFALAMLVSSVIDLTTLGATALRAVANIG